MKKICKMIISLSLMLGLVYMLLPCSAFAQGSSGTIDIVQYDASAKVPVAGIRLTLYRVAIPDGNGGYDMTPEFAGASVSVDDMTDSAGARKATEVLDRYIADKGISGIETKVTGNDGAAGFHGLADGIYFIKQTNTKADFKRLGYTYRTDSYLIMLPHTDENGLMTRYVSCKPKGELKYPGKTEDIIVHKVWKDSSDSKGRRPESITVGLYCDGSLKGKKTLDAANNWTYQWNDLDSSRKWEIKELGVPEGYISKVTSEDGTFTVTNTWNPEKYRKTRTGDRNNMAPYIAAACIAAAVLIITAGRKKKS